jgi:hypothetical protein
LPLCGRERRSLEERVDVLVVLVAVRVSEEAGGRHKRTSFPEIAEV